MDTLKAYKNFIHGRYFSEGIRITAGILIPSFIASYFGMLSTGLTLSVGALCVSITDSPGPISHRLRGMIISAFLCSLISIIIYYSSFSHLLLAFIITLSGFVFSMLTIYGSRSSSIGIAVLIMMVLSLASPLEENEILTNALLVLSGGLWYSAYSLTLYRIRPYKLIQQIMGDYINGIGNYLGQRASFYEVQPDYERIYKKLLEQQVSIDHTQQLLSELLYKTRAITKEPSRRGRVLLKIYLDVTDLYESIMTTYQEYAVLHNNFGETGIMKKFGEAIKLLSSKILHLGLAVKINDRLQFDPAVKTVLVSLRNNFELLRLTHMKGERVNDFVSLGRIMANIEDLAAKTEQLHSLTGNAKVNKTDVAGDHYNMSQDIRLKIFFNNLNFNSDIFRHSLRVGLALLAGYGISFLISIGHSYWTLLTIVIILKPAYGLTKQINRDRIIGTVTGLLVAVVFLLYIKNEDVLLALMIFFMAGSYIFLRTNYFISVFCNSIYLLVLFQILYKVPFTEVLGDRLVDTMIGSGISILASLFIVPAWQKNTIGHFMKEMLKANKDYYLAISGNFTNEMITDTDTIRKKRRAMLVHLSNLTDAFHRMISEPKQFQARSEKVFRFVVTNHTIVSHMATLSYFLKTNDFRTPMLKPVVHNTAGMFDSALKCLDHTESEFELHNDAALNDYVQSISLARKKEIENGLLETEMKKKLVKVKSVTDQFQYIFNISKTIVKICK